MMAIRQSSAGAQCALRVIIPLRPTAGRFYSVRRGRDKKVNGPSHITRKATPPSYTIAISEDLPKMNERLITHMVTSRSQYVPLRSGLPTVAETICPTIKLAVFSAIKLPILSTIIVHIADIVPPAATAVLADTARPANG